MVRNRLSRAIALLIVAACGDDPVAAPITDGPDTTPPTIELQVLPSGRPTPPCSCGDLVFVPGDTIRVRVRATDQHSLRWIRIGWLAHRDSVPASSSADSAYFEIIVPPGANAQDARVSAWAIDASGNIAYWNVWAWVVDGIVRPSQTLQLTGLTGAVHHGGGRVLDARRERLYFATGRDNKVGSVGLDPLEQGLVASFDNTVRTVDLTPSGDSLVAVLEQPTRLVVWPVDAGAGSADTVMVQHATGDVTDMRVAANGHALVTAFDLIDVDLSSGVQRLRTLGGGPVNLAVSPDRRYIVQWEPLRAAVYSSDRDSLGPLRELFVPPPAPIYFHNLGPSVHSDGSSLNRNRLFDANLDFVKPILPDPEYYASPQALSADGRFAYIADWPGYWKVDVQSGAVLERVILPWWPGRLMPHPDGQRLIVITGSLVGVVQLN